MATLLDSARGWQRKTSIDGTFQLGPQCPRVGAAPHCRLSRHGNRILPGRMHGDLADRGMPDRGLSRGAGLRLRIAGIVGRRHDPGHGGIIRDDDDGVRAEIIRRSGLSGHLRAGSPSSHRELKET